MAHPLLALLLFLEELALAGDVAAVALRRHVLADLAHCLAGDDFRADGCLDGNVELLARNEFLELQADLPAEIIRVVLVDEGGQGVCRVTVQQDVQLHQAGRPEIRHVIVEGGVALGDGLEFVVEVEDHLGTPPGRW